MLVVGVSGVGLFEIVCGVVVKFLDVGVMFCIKVLEDIEVD